MDVRWKGLVYKHTAEHKDGRGRKSFDLLRTHALLLMPLKKFFQIFLENSFQASFDTFGSNITVWSTHCGLAIFNNYFFTSLILNTVFICSISLFGMAFSAPETER